MKLIKKASTLDRVCQGTRLAVRNAQAAKEIAADHPGEAIDLLRMVVADCQLLQRQAEQAMQELAK